MNAVRPAAVLTTALFVIGVALQSDLPASVAAEISGADAVKRALEYTGIGVQPEVAVSAERDIVPADDNVPFLRLAGNPAWRVIFDNVRLVVRGPDGKPYENPAVHRLDVWLNRADGRLLKIISPFPADLEPSLEPTLSKREDGMKRSSRGYDGLPIEMPRINLIQALQSVAEGLGGTTQAKQIEALYVLSRRTVSKETVPTAVPCREAPCTRWEITLRYLPPVRPIGLAGPGGKPPRITLPPFMHFRHDVDPGTGKWLRAETVP